MLPSISSLLALLLLLIIARTAFAHAGLVSSDPAAGQTLDASPDEIRLTFTDPLQLGSSFILFGSGFQNIDGIAPTIDATTPQQLVADSIPKLNSGKYTVQWTVIGTDGDETSGTYSFTLTPRTSKSTIAIALGVAAIAIVTASTLLLRRNRTQPV